MSDKHSTPIGQFWMMAGIGSAMLASRLMLDTAIKVHRAGRPARQLMGAAPFAMAGWVLSQMGSREKVAVLPAEGLAPQRKRSLEASEAELVAEPAPVEVPQNLIETMVEAPLEALAQSFAPLAAEADAMLETAPGSEDAVADEPATPDEYVGEILAEPAAPEAEVAAEPAAEAGRLTALAAPRGAGADDLTLIKGVGPKLAAQLNALGYFHFDQIAAWGEAELAWVDSNLHGFAGRATRDDWIGQAKAMLADAAPEGERLL